MVMRVRRRSSRNLNTQNFIKNNLDYLSISLQSLSIEDISYMTTDKIKVGGMYKIYSPVLTRDEDNREQELLVRVLAVKENGLVEIVFPPFNTCRWAAASKIEQLG